jgi:single-strand DNA-binding protein
MLKLNLQAIGNITKDASLRTTQGGKDVLSFTIAVNHGNKDNQRTEYVDCSIWGERARSKLGEYLTKGTKVAVNGVPGVNAYVTESGEARGSLTLMVDQIELMGGNSQQAQSGHQAPAQQRQTQAPAQRQQRQAQAPAQQEQVPDDLDW